MKAVRVLLSLLAVLGLSAALSPTARAEYQIVTLDVPGLAGYSLAYGINNSGQISGVTVDETTLRGTGFIYSGGSYTMVNAPGAVNGTEGLRINNRGDAVMYGFDENWRSMGYVLSDGVYTTFSPPGTDGVPSDISDNGDVLGTAFSEDINDPNIYSYILSNGTYTPFTVPGAASVLAFGMNDVGGISGSILTPEGYIQGFLYSGGQFTSIRVPEGYVTNTLGLNNKGSVVGSYRNADFNDSGFVYRGGVYTTINIPGALSVYVYDINDHEDIVGYYIGADGTYNAFVGHAVVPEPSSMALAALGFGAVGWAAVRRRARRS
jgi:hypothetical protein